MGFFSKIKDNFTGGGVKVIVDAPPLFTDSIPVRVKIEASAPQTINSVKIYLEKRTFSDNDTSTTDTGTTERLYETPLAGQFAIQAGQSTILEGTIATSMASQLDNAAGQTDQAVPQATQQIASAIDTFSNVFGAISNKRVEYHVVAIADVEGVTFDPSDKIDIQKQEIGQISAATRTPRF